MSNLEIVTDIANEYQRVTEQSLFTRPAVYLDDGDNKRVGTHKAIVNELGDPIAVVGINYNLVQNADILPRFHEVILASNLDRTGMTKNIQQSHYGAKTIVTYTVPAHEIEITNEHRQEFRKAKKLSQIVGKMKAVSNFKLSATAGT